LTRNPRRFAANVSADAAGYSRPIGLDDSRTRAAMKGDRGELIDPEIAECGGRIVNEFCDGLRLEFPSVVDGVRCATDVGMRCRRITGVIREVSAQIIGIEAVFRIANLFRPRLVKFRPSLIYWSAHCVPHHRSRNPGP